VRRDHVIRPLSIYITRAKASARETVLPFTHSKSRCIQSLDASRITDASFNSASLLQGPTAACADFEPPNDEASRHGDWGQTCGRAQWLGTGSIATFFFVSAIWPLSSFL
jgi:hypothetical protein